jgi:hypothetical protein
MDAVDKDQQFISENSGDQLSEADSRVLVFESLTTSYNDIVDVKTRARLTLMDLDSDVLMSDYEVQYTLDKLVLDGLIEQCGYFYRTKIN